MCVSIEELGGLERRMTFCIPEERIYDAVQSRIKELSRHVNVDGFRKGKVPPAVVDKRLGPQVRQEVISGMLISAFYEAAKQERLKVASSPKIELKSSLDANAALVTPEFVATFEVYPDFELAPVEQILIERPVAVIEDADVDGMLSALQRLRLEWAPVDRPAQEGDRVVVDLQGFMDDEPLKAIRRIPFILGVPSKGGVFGSLVQDEFAQQLMGSKPGETLAMEVGFPDDYTKAYLAGQTVGFTMRVCSVEEPKLPCLDDAFAQQMGASDMAGLRRQTRHTMEQEMREASLAQVKQQVLDALLAINPIDVPKVRLENEYLHLLEQVRTRMVADGLQEKDIEIASILVKDKAKNHIALGLILAKIVRDNDIKASKTLLDRVIKDLAADYDNPEEIEEWYRNNPDSMAELESTALEDQVVDWVLECAQVVENPVSFSQFMKSKG